MTMTALWLDIRYALRTMIRTPGLTAVFSSTFMVRVIFADQSFNHSISWRVLS